MHWAISPVHPADRLINPTTNEDYLHTGGVTCNLSCGVIGTSTPAYALTIWSYKSGTLEALMLITRAYGNESSVPLFDPGCLLWL